MKRTQSSPWIVALLATFAGTSGAEVRQGTRAQAPGRLEQPVLTEGAPAECRRYLEVPADTTSALLPWQQRLSLAACRQSITLAPVTDMRGLLAALATLDRAMAPSIGIYRDAMARAPNEIRIRAAYGLGMTYVNMMARARNLIRGGAYGGATYGAPVDPMQSLRSALEPLLVARRDAALAAFDEVARLAAADRAAARANQVVIHAVQDARRQTALLR